MSFRSVLVGLLLLALAGLARAQSFPIQRVEVEGNTVLPEPAVREAIAELEGRSVTLADLQRVAGALRTVYEKAGYFLVRVQVPTQSLTDGVVRLKVVEGRVGRLRVEGNEHYSEELIRSYLQPLLDEKVARLDTLHRGLFLLKDLMNLQVESFVEPGSEPGTADLIVKAKDSLPFEVGLSYDNFGNRFTGEHRFTVAPHAGNLFGNGESLYVATVVPFPSVEFQPYLLAALQVPVNRDGTRVGASYANGAFTVGGDLGVLDIRGRADLYSLFVSHALVRAEYEKGDLLLALNSKTYDNTILGAPSSHDEIRSLSFGYRGEWTGEDTRDLAFVALTQGLGDVLGGTPNGSPTASRPGAGNSFTRLNLDYAHVQSLGHPFLVLRAGGQVASNPLVVGEQFSLGGPDSVRGYNQSEFLGDAGYAASAELRIPLPDPDSRFQLACFVDHGTEWLYEPLPGEFPQRSLTGAGLGFRWEVAEKTHLRFDLGFPLSPSFNSTGESPKLYGQFETRF